MQVLFDTVECLDLSQALLRDWSCARLGHIMQFAAGMGPAIGQRHILRRAFEQAVVTSISIDLQDTAEAFQNIVCMLAGSSGRIGEGYSGRIITAPRPVITGQRPEVSGFGAFAPG